jgi:hypothetical protein
MESIRIGYHSSSAYAGEAFKSSNDGVCGFGGYVVTNLFQVNLVYVL